MKKKEIYIDYAKGIGIILVMIGHVPNISFLLKKFIYSFHMPLFFMLNGILFNVKHLKMEYNRYIYKTYNVYIKPYLKFTLLFFIVYTVGLNLIKLIMGKQIDYKGEILKKIIGIFYSRGTTEWLPNSSPLWFLTCIFVMNLLFYLILKSKRKNYLILTTVLGVILTITKPLKFINESLGESLPWNIDTALIGLPFLFYGYSLKEQINKINLFKIGISLFLFIGVFLKTKTIIAYDGNKYGNYLFIY